MRLFKLLLLAFAGLFLVSFASARQSVPKPAKNDCVQTCVLQHDCSVPDVAYVIKNYSAEPNAVKCNRQSIETKYTTYTIAYSIPNTAKNSYKTAFKNRYVGWQNKKLI